MLNSVNFFFFSQIFHKHINLDTTAINEERLKQQGIDLSKDI